MFRVGTTIQDLSNELFYFRSYGTAPADETLRGPFRMKTVMGRRTVFILSRIPIGFTISLVQCVSFIIVIGLHVREGINDCYLFPGIFKGNTIVVFTGF